MGDGNTHAQYLHSSYIRRSPDSLAKNRSKEVRAMRQRWIGLVLCMVLMLGWVPATAAQMKTTYRGLQLYYWSASASGGGSSWTTGYWDLEYGMIQANSPWGYHLHYLTGNQSGGPGGTSTFWNVEASYLLRGRGDLDLRAKLGYGSYGWTAPGAPGAVTSAGFRVGVSAIKPLQANPGGGGLSLHAGFNWSPSNSSQSSTGSSTGAVTDWSIALFYKFPSRMMATAAEADQLASAPTRINQQPISPPILGDDWGAALGVRGVTADAGTAASAYNWSGLFFGVSKNF